MHWKYNSLIAGLSILGIFIVFLSTMELGIGLFIIFILMCITVFNLVAMENKEEENAI